MPISKVGSCIASVIFFLAMFSCKTVGGKKDSSSGLLYSKESLTLEDIKSKTCPKYVRDGQCFLRLNSYEADKKDLKEFDDQYKTTWKDIDEDKQKKILKVDLPLEDEEKKAIYLYTADEYIGWNALLREVESKDYSWKMSGSGIYVAASAITKMSRHGKSFTGVVYRGDSVSLENFSNIVNVYKPGAYVVERAFVSSSSKLGEADEFSGYFNRGTIFLKIHSKTGVAVKELSAQPAENEILFTPGSVFRVIDAKLKSTEANWLDVEMEEVEVKVQ